MRYYRVAPLSHEFPVTKISHPESSEAGFAVVRLSPREAAVLRFVVQGKSNRDIVEETGLSYRWVRQIIQEQLVRGLNLRNRGELQAWGSLHPSALVPDSFTRLADAHPEECGCDAILCSALRLGRAAAPRQTQRTKERKIA